MAEHNFDFYAASAAPCCCLPMDGIFTCDNCCNSFSPLGQLLEARWHEAETAPDTNPAPCKDCQCIPCFCHSSNYITSSRINSAAADQAEDETAPMPSPGAATSPAAPHPSPKLTALPDHMLSKMHAFMGAAGALFAAHEITKIADIIFDDWHVVATSRHYTWDSKRDHFHLALHQCNYMMHVTDKIMDDLDDYNFDYFKASATRTQIKHVMAKLINHWATEAGSYLASSAESQ